MPASARALRISGIAERAGFDNSARAGPRPPGLPRRRHPGARAVADRQRAQRRRPDHLRRARSIVLHRRLRLAPGALRLAADARESRVMREVRPPESELPLETASFMACVATILELRFEDLPAPAADEDPATGWTHVAGGSAASASGSPAIADAAVVLVAGAVDRADRRPVRRDVRRAVGRRVGSRRRSRGGARRDLEDGFLVAAADIALALAAASGRAGRRGHRRGAVGRRVRRVSPPGCCEDGPRARRRADSRATGTSPARARSRRARRAAR